MVDLDAPAEEIEDPLVLLRRIAFRNARLLDSTGGEQDPVLFVHTMASLNRTDLRRLCELLGHDISDLIP